MATDDTPTVRSIVAEYLAAHGYGGLRASLDDCGCTDDDLMPCDSSCDDCEPAYKVKSHCADCDSTSCERHGTSDDDDWCLTSEKPEAEEQ
jgi:hypothetical protein